MTDHTIEEVRDPEQIERIGELRIRAWKTELQRTPPMASWLDEYDKSARHWACLVNGVPVAAARMTVHDSIDTVPDAEVYRSLDGLEFTPPIASFNRLVVEPSHRKMGLGTALDRIRIEAAIEMGCKMIVASSSNERRISQLKKLGFQSIGTTNKNPQPIYTERGNQTVLYLRLP